MSRWRSCAQSAGGFVRSVFFGSLATLFFTASAHATLVVSQSVSANTIVVGDTASANAGNVTVQKLVGDGSGG
mgnify:CR=1 FL=1